jgi:hypothetical protein
MVVITSIVTMAILFPVAGALRKRVENQAKTHGRRVIVHHKEPLV